MPNPTFSSGTLRHNKRGRRVFLRHQRRQRRRHASPTITLALYAQELPERARQAHFPPDVRLLLMILKHYPRPLAQQPGIGKRIILRPQACQRDSVDEDALDLRLPHQPALYAEDQTNLSGPTWTTSSVATTRPIATTGRKPTASPRFAYDDLLKRDKVSLDIFWLKDDSLEDSANLPELDVIAAEIAEDLQAALDQFAQIAGELRKV